MVYHATHLLSSPETHLRPLHTLSPSLSKVKASLHKHNALSSLPVSLRATHATDCPEFDKLVNEKPLSNGLVAPRTDSAAHWPLTGRAYMYQSEISTSGLRMWVTSRESISWSNEVFALGLTTVTLRSFVLACLYAG